MPYDYDVAFSFASGQQPYVQRVYEILSSRQVRVFYHGGDVALGWGDDLLTYLTEIYSERARLCVVFLSKEYGQSLWTQHEFKAAQARAFKGSEPYLLPARFDDTAIPGLLDTVRYIDLQDLSPEAFADLVLEKLGKTTDTTPLGQQAVAISLEAFLAEAVIYAEEYLKSGGLELADAVADAVRRSFRRAALKIERRHLLPYLRSGNAAHRVTAYIAWQELPQKDTALDFVAAIRSEKEEASSSGETRPLWQLLVAIGKFLRLGLDPTETTLLRTALREQLEWMRDTPRVDRGGQCKSRIQWLLEHAPLVSE